MRFLSSLPFFSLSLAAALVSQAIAFPLNYNPGYKSYNDTHNPADIVSSARIGMDIASKVDANNGQASGLQIQGGAITKAALDQTNSVSVLAKGTATPRMMAERAADEIHLRDFGAVGDGNADDTAALQAWLALCETGAHACFADAGHYRITQSLTIQEPLKGFKLSGAGMNATVLDFSSVAGTSLSIVSAVGDKTFYGTLSDLSIIANNAGAAVDVGKDDESDAINSFELRNIDISNLATGSGVVALRLNYVVASTISNVIANNAGMGDALLCTNCVMDVVSGSFSTARNALHIRGYSEANSFNSVDLENICNGLVIDADSVTSNTWVSPKVGALMDNCPSTSFFVASAGHGNYVLNPEFGPFNAQQAVAGGTIGVTWHSDRYGSATPNLPPSGTAIANTTGRTMLVTLTNGAVSSVVANGITYTNGASSTGVQSVLLPANASISVTYTGSPSWVWQAL